MLIKNIKKYITLIVTGMPALILTLTVSCRSDEDFSGGIEYQGNGVLDFTGKVNNDNNSSTRALTNPPEYVQNAIFGKNNFYIEMDMDTTINDVTETIVKHGEYIVPTGMAGLLEHKNTTEENPKLNWNNPLSPHYFWSWTVPWMDDYSSSSTPDGENPDGNTDEGETTPGEDGDETQTRADEHAGDNGSDTPSEGTNNPYANKIRYVINSTVASDITNNVEWPNGSILENFIGTTTGPLDYKTNGKDVELQYKHLVSKIRMEKFVLIDAYGNAQTQVAGTLSFINMPNAFDFYPHPDGTVEGIEKNSAPIAVTDFSTADMNSVQLSFALYQPDPAEDEPPVELYVCPEIDFSKVLYKVDITYPEKYANRGSYWGDFGNLNFERIPDTDYDNPGEDPDAAGYPADKTILHAGEMMLFTLQVKEIGGSGISCTLSPWATGEDNAANHHSHPGIYSDTEAKQLADANGNAETLEALFELFGSGYTDDNENDPHHDLHLGIIRLYRDVTLSGMSFPVGKDYILDGMGYMITLTPTSSNPSKVTLGRMRDIHIRVPGEPEYMIYVDEQGRVWWEDPKTGEMLITTHALDNDSQTLDLANLTFPQPEPDPTPEPDPEP